MRFQAKHSLGFFVAVILAMPIWAGVSNHTDSTPFDIDHATTIGQTQLDPGLYTLQAKESENQLEILQNDKVVATVPCHWITLSKKAPESEVMRSQDHVTEVDFQGRMQAIKIG